MRRSLRLQSFVPALAGSVVLTALALPADAARPERYRDPRDHRGPELHERGHLLRELPLGCRAVEVRGVRYFERGGVYFREAPGGYLIVDAPETGIVLTPAIGSVMATLPVGAVTVTIGTEAYYRHGNVFYRRHSGGYVVVERPAAAVVLESQPVPQVISKPAPPPSTEYTSVWVGNQEFLTRDGLFYKRLPEGLRLVEAPPGVLVAAPPVGSLDMWIGDKEYFYFNSTFYQKRPNGYEVIPPPRDAYIRALPQRAKTIWSAARKLFYLDGNFYEQRDQGYLITSAPIVLTAPTISPGTVVAAPPEGSVDFWVNDTEYLYFAGNFFRKQPTGYVVVPNPLT